MDKKFQTLIATLATLCLASPAFAESTDDDPGETIHFNDVELGVGYVSDTAWKFGQYNGLYDEGPYGIANIHYKNTNEDNAKYLEIRGTNLGLESRYLRLDAGVQGQQEYFFVYDELPNYQNNTALSPYHGIGSSTLTLPTGYDWASLNGYLNPVELKTKRQRFDFGAAFLTSKSWKFDIKGSHQTKEGVQQIGGATNYSGGTQTVGFTYATMLPEPIDYETNEMDVGVHYSHKKGQLDLVYHVSLFENDNASLAWQDPFIGYPTLPGGTTLPAYGQLALAPSNQHHQVTLSGGYNFPSQTRFTGLVSVGRSTQNEDLLPYGTESGGALPRNTAETEVWTTKVGLKLASRPIRKLRLSGEYRYDGRDNQTPVDTWNYVLADSTANGGTATNAPLSWDKHKVDLDANYRINYKTSIRGGYEYRRTDREYTDALAEREQTEENSLYAKLKYRPTDLSELAFYAEGGTRDGSEYNTPTGQNPVLRKFYLADRERGKIGGLLNYMPTNQFSFGIKAEYIEDDYTDSEIGLTDANQTLATLDATYIPRENITTYAYYTYEDIRSSQAGQEGDITTGIPPGADWTADFDDRIDTVGIGTAITNLNNKWDIGADLTYSQSTGTIEMASTTGTASQYPDLKTSLGSLKLWTIYKQSKKLSYKFSYWYEDYSADNWALDGIDPDTVENMLLMGEDTLDYDVHVVGASAIYSF